MMSDSTGEVARLVRARRFGTPEMREALACAWFLEPEDLLRRFGCKLVRELMFACRHPHPISAPTTIYRGGEMNTLLASWSLDLRVACFHAGAGGYVLRGIVRPEDVLFYIGEANEAEVIPLSVEQVTRIEGNRWIRRAGALPPQGRAFSG